ncbi:pyrimidine/purine nucleoside phosphorylase [Bacilliculturomica massiliensis]|uniref:pyrimidine/purine nucleoside phosphorylase n=1 Tax=Bacilliculturomica massiliensis TaxID=1917867 RepID=UPI0010304FD8|nr:pyrimidine/purine nucleoside phosphorylase [Bacilliculturomica massiliensis]
MIDKVLKNVQVESKANVYFDGKVTSRTCYRQDGGRFTLGIITAGSYTFDVGDREVVQLIAGSAEVLLPGEENWRAVAAQESFEIGADCKYQIRTDGVAEYLCDYYKD